MGLQGGPSPNDTLELPPLEVGPLQQQTMRPPTGPSGVAPSPTPVHIPPQVTV